MAAVPVVALEIGTWKVGALVGEEREDGNIMVTGMGQCPSCGVRKGVITDLENAVACVETAIRGAEQSSKVEIREVYLVVSGGHIQSFVNQGNVKIFDAGRGITVANMEEAMEIARTINLPHDGVVFHSIPQKYSVDDQQGIMNPAGMHGARLSLEMLIIYGSNNVSNNIRKVVHDAGVEMVADSAFSGLCAALATLTPEQKECGVALIDLGAGTSSYVVYTDHAIATAGVLAVGGDHITNDIALGFNISMKRAETLKHESGCAIVDSSTHFQRLAVPAEVGFSGCSIAASDLHAIINARVDETLQMVRNDLERKGISRHLGAGVVLTGGGAHLKGIVTATERVFDLPCAIGKPKNYSGMATAESPEYAALLGMLRYAFKCGRRGEEQVSFGGMLQRLFGGGK